LEENIYCFEEKQLPVIIKALKFSHIVYLVKNAKANAEFKLQYFKQQNLSI